MNCFKELDFPNYVQSDLEIKNYFYNQYPNPSVIGHFWNYPKKNIFLEMCPTVLDGFKQLGLTFKAIFMIGINVSSRKNVHIDYASDSCRLQWPVHNPHSVDTAWYEARKEDQIIQVLPNGVYYVSYKNQDCKEIVRLNITKPTIIRVDQPHSVLRNSDSPLDFPRVAFSFAFDNDLTNMLE